MPIITLPDGQEKHFPGPITVAEVAASIGTGLAKAAIAGRVDGVLVDTSYVIEQDVPLSIVTGKDPEGLEVIRHSTAHLLAHAVKQLFPETQVTIGPVIEDGFYYDFARPTPFSVEDLSAIEARMTALAEKDYPVVRKVMARDEAIQFFRDMGEAYKANIIEDIPEDQTLSLYEQGDFIDLCRGPHVPHTGMLKAFKLTKISGAYWRGDPKNEMLQRIYGTAWPDKQSLKDYLHRIEEAEKRDHRKLARKMDLFHLQEEAPGMVFWHPDGWAIYQAIEQHVRGKYKKNGYQEIRTPQLLDCSLWQKSGHLEKFGDEMFYSESESHRYAIKPMNCPCHVQVFKQGLRSYRDLPLRLAEFGTCHRNEPSGSLHGLMRARSFVQDDGHIFCTEAQIASESAHFIQQVFEMYEDFGFRDIQVMLSTRPDKRIGSDEVWDVAEQALENVLNEAGIVWKLQPGEGAFYGPKIEFSLKDCLGRIWQLGTLQIDFSMPERLGAHYIAEDGAKKVPVMLHRATLGSMERFLGILLEEHAGRLPLWLAPVQMVVLNITDAQKEFVSDLVEILKNNDFRVTADLRNEKIGFKIREHTLKNVPYLLVVGDKEVASRTVAVRTRSGTDLGVLSISDFVQKAKQEIKDRMMAEMPVKL